MLLKLEVLQKLSEAQIVAVIRGKDAKEAISIARASIKGGFQAIEVTYTTPQAEKVIEGLVKDNCLVGAGTVLDVETARHALLHGARFIVSPHFDQAISKICNRYNVPYLPGCFTIGEMVKALESGSDVIKLFPANQISPSYMKAINGPLPHVQMMPTGGINLSNFKEWLDMGAFAVGIGSDLVNAYRKNGASSVIKHCEQYINILNGRKG